MEVNGNTMKIEKMDGKDATVEYLKKPETVKGKWVQLLKEMKESEEGAKVTGLSRGSAYSLARQAKEKGFNARTTDKGTTVIIAPKPSESTKK